MSVKIHGYFVEEEELNDEPDFRCPHCESNKIWSRLWRQYVDKRVWDIRYECQGCGEFWWAELEHWHWLRADSFYRVIHGLPDPLDPQRKMG